MGESQMNDFLTELDTLAKKYGYEVKGFKDRIELKKLEKYIPTQDWFLFCPHCGKRYKGSEEYYGKMKQCECGNLIIFPYPPDHPRYVKPCWEK